METIAPPETAPEAPPRPAGTDHGRGHFDYKPALDGLRAVAVLAVFAYHLDYGWAKGGFLGVDMFFVLSGYLITSLLLVEWGRSGTIRFGAFWARRARRLLPAVFVLLIAVAIAGRILLSSDEWGRLRADSLWTMFYGANWHFIWEGQSYFTANPSPLRHTWSLAIEEQFYLVWPLVVFTCLRLARGRTYLLAGVTVLGVLGSVVALAQHFTPGADPSRAYYGTDGRASQMLVGALLGMLLLRWNPVTRASRLLLQVLAGGASVLIIWAFVDADDQGSTLYDGGFLVFAVCTAVLIAAMVQPTRNPMRSALSLRPVRWIGAVSYGVYLWHWPIIVFVDESRTGLSGWSLDLLRIALTFVIAAISYYAIELPIRQRRFRTRWAPRTLVPVGIGVTLAAVLLSTAGATENQLARAPGTVLESEGATRPVAPPSTRPGELAPPTTRVLLLGDSVAASLGDALVETAAADGVTARAVTRLGCGMTTGITLDEDGGRIPWSPDCAAATVEYQRLALDDVRPDTVLWISTWEIADYEVDGERLRFGTEAWDRWFSGEMERVRAAVAEHGARLVLVTNPPVAPNPIRTVSAEDHRRNTELNARYQEFARRHPDVALVDLASIVCPGGTPCPTTQDGIVLRPKDGGHYEAEGAAWAARRLLDELYTVLRAKEASTQEPPPTAPDANRAG